MSISTYADLQNQVISFLHRASLLDAVDSDNVPDLILLGEKWIFRHARTSEMESSLSVTISSGVATVPTDYLALKHARIDASPTRYLKMRPASWIYEHYPTRSSDSKPFFIGRDGTDFIFGPYPDSNYTVLGTYYAKPTSIQSSANSLFTANPDIYLFASLAEAEAYVKNDKRIPLWVAKREQIMKDMNDQTKEGEYGIGMEVSVDFAV